MNKSNPNKPEVMLKDLKTMATTNFFSTENSVTLSLFALLLAVLLMPLSNIAAPIAIAIVIAFCMNKSLLIGLKEQVKEDRRSIFAATLLSFVGVPLAIHQILGVSQTGVTPNSQLAVMFLGMVSLAVFVSAVILFAPSNNAR